MKNEFVSYKMALALKKLGFNEICFAWYKNGKLMIELYWNLSDGGTRIVVLQHSHKHLDFLGMRSYLIVAYAGIKIEMMEVSIITMLLIMILVLRKLNMSKKDFFHTKKQN